MMRTFSLRTGAISNMILHTGAGVEQENTDDRVSVES